MERHYNKLEVIYMKTVEKALLAGGLFLTGYLMGFYEMKYRTLKVLLKASTERKWEEPHY